MLVAEALVNLCISTGLTELSLLAGAIITEILCTGPNVVCNIRIYHEFEGRIEKIVPGIAVWHHEVCRFKNSGEQEKESIIRVRVG